MTTTPPPEGTTEPLKRGQEFYAAGLGLFLTVIRVARDATWADVFVAQPATGATWSKRQRLIDGAFPFTAHEVTR